MNDFAPGDIVYAGPTRAEFVKHISAGQAVIRVGMDTRVVDPVSLRRAS